MMRRAGVEFGKRSAMRLIFREMWVGVLVAVLMGSIGGGNLPGAEEERRTEDGDEAGREFFEKEIRPLLVTHCLECHGEEKQEGGLRLTTRKEVLAGGDAGEAVVPMKPGESLLMQAVEYLEDPKMPPKGKLSDGEIAKLRKWIEIGVPWGVESQPKEGGGAVKKEFEVTDKQRGWWAFQGVKDPVVPTLKHGEWVQNEIDCFIGEKLEREGISVAGEADRRSWLRRVTFDLTGLPPTPEELEAFQADESGEAYERVVDRLLGSPAYGEKYARHWLDVVRYADYHDGDAKARDLNCEPMEAWRYRDWVVSAFNGDLPFDQFIEHQICGDLLASPEGKDYYAEGLIATTFLSNGSWDRGDADKEKMVSDMVDDNIDTIGKAFMGMTLGCARCHDHKFDPVSQEDYYGLAGVFYSTRILKDLGAKGGNYFLNRVPLAEKEYVAKWEEQVAKLKELNGKLAELDKMTPKPSEDDPKRKELTAARDQVQAEMPSAPPMAEAASEGGTPGGLFPGIQDVPIHIRGSYTRLGEVVPRRMPRFLAGNEQAPITAGSGRREVAKWVSGKSNPLTARVIVNRMWQWHFGSGIVRTPNNFGILSEPPSHPELLDWLAARLMEENWSLKEMHRRMALSGTYRRTGKVTVEEFGRDPDNRFFGRFAARRLDAEEIRDAMLSVNGSLTSVPGGAADDQLSGSKRSLYLQTARWDRSSFATLFDAANPDASVEARTVSTVAPQALFLMNHPFVQEQAGKLAERLVKEIPAEEPNCAIARIERGYRLLYGRSPSEVEAELVRGLVTGSDAAGWKDAAHVMLCSNEFVYVD